MASLRPPKEWKRQNAVKTGMSAALVSAGAGLLVSSVQNALQTHNRGALGVFSRTGSTIALFTAMGGLFSFTQCAAGTLRRVDDGWNAFWGGAAAGAAGSLRRGTIPAFLGSSLFLGGVMGVLEWTGGSFSGFHIPSDPGEREGSIFTYTKRRSMQETKRELGL